MEENELNPRRLSLGIPNTCKRIVNSLYFSCTCRVIYLLLLLYNIILAVWVIHTIIYNQSFDILFYTLESILNAILVIDVGLRMWIKTCYRYWKEYVSYFEFFFVFACTCCTILGIVCNLNKQFSEIERRQIRRDSKSCIISYSLCFSVL